MIFSAWSDWPDHTSIDVLAVVSSVVAPCDPLHPASVASTAVAARTPDARSTRLRSGVNIFGSSSRVGLVLILLVYRILRYRG